MKDKAARLKRVALAVMHYFDWRFLLSLSLLLAVIWLTLNGFNNARELRAKSHRVDQLISLIREQQKAADARDAASAVERSLMLENQNRMLANQQQTLLRQKQTERAQRHLLRWLQAHGINLPASLLHEIRVEHVTRTVRVPTKPTSQPRPKPAPAPPNTSGGSTSAPTLPNGKPAPGNSGSAPGHNKH